MRSKKIFRKLLFVIIFVYFYQFLGLIDVKAVEVEENNIITGDNLVGDVDLNLDDMTDVSSSYKVYLDDEDTLEYVLEDNDVLVKQSYEGDISEYTFNTEEEFVMDYTNHLYGIYNYKFLVLHYEEIIESKDIIINYMGDNNSIINTKGIFYKDKTYYILGNAEKNHTVLDVLNMFNIELNQYNASIEIIDGEGIEKLATDEVSSGDKVKLSASYIEYGNKNDIVDFFNIEIIDDINGDGLIDNLDIKASIINSLVDDENLFDIKDIFDGEIDEEVDVTDILNSVVEYEDKVFVGEYLEVKYHLNGFINDSLMGVVGKINYDKTLLELDSISIDNIYGLYNEEGKFSYLLNNYNKNGIFLVFKFKVLEVGSSNISLEQIDFLTSLGDKVDVLDSLFNINVLGIEYGKGGDVEEDNSDDEILEETDKEEVEKEEINEEVEEDKKEIITLEKDETVYSKPEIYESILPSNGNQNISLSNDNYIKDLKIKGYDIDFDKDVFEYDIKVSEDVFDLEFDIELSDKDAFYTILGNEKFEIGNNKVSIVVTALDGTTRSYVVNVKKSGNVLSEEVDSLEDEKKSSRKIIIMLIILIIIGLVYIIFKDEDEVN